MSIEWHSRISGIVLAAGQSRRMGIPKAICPWGQVTFLEAVISCLRAVKIENIGIVLGAWEYQIRRHGIPDGVNIWVNPHYRLGQLTSLQTALKYQKPDALAVIMALVDHPAVKPDTINALIDAFDGDPQLVVKPVYKSTGGHPILIGRQWWQEILNALPNENQTDVAPPTLRHILARHRDRIITVEVDDAGILLDVDTPDILSRRGPNHPQ